MILKNVALRFLGTGLFVWAIAVLGVTFVTVASAEADEPPCPVCHPTKLTCDGSPCYCEQTGPNTGIWLCIKPDDPQ